MTSCSMTRRWSLSRRLPRRERRQESCMALLSSLTKPNHLQRTSPSECRHPEKEVNSRRKGRREAMMTSTTFISHRSSLLPHPQLRSARQLARVHQRKRSLSLVRGRAAPARVRMAIRATKTFSQRRQHPQVGAVGKNGMNRSRTLS